MPFVIANDPLGSHPSPGFPRRRQFGHSTGRLSRHLLPWIAAVLILPLAHAASSDPFAGDLAAHWAFQPIRQPTPPPASGRHAARIRNPIDQFVLARLEQSNLEPAQPADRRTLVRRLHHDLTGVPPDPDAVDRFVADDRPDAAARLIDRLLASPRYGERWGRHWLDVARYADTKGYVFEEERRYPYSFTYRDYVIRSFNEDLPFDRFIREQIAADQLALGNDRRPLAALGYLTLGRRFLNNRHDIIDDRIDVVSRGLMGLTVSCARCHDHKFDPIPTEDYYALYGVFASSYEPDEPPLLGDSELPAAYPEFIAATRAKQEELDSFREKQTVAARERVRNQAGDYLLAATRISGSDDAAAVDKKARELKLDPAVVKQWMEALDRWRTSNHPVFVPWFRIDAAERTATAPAPASGSASAPGNAAPEAGTVDAIDAIDAVKSVNPFVLEHFDREKPASLEAAARTYQAIFDACDPNPGPGISSDAAAGSDGEGSGSTGERVESKEAIRVAVFGPDGPCHLSDRVAAGLFDVKTRQRIRKLRRDLTELEATHPGAPPRAMALLDRDTPVNPVVFKRGDPNRRGAPVERRFLSALGDASGATFAHGSGRLELAEAIVSRDNPLTARVLVNRVWQHHFGFGLVRTPADFGIRSEPPSHPGLLDWLAFRFQEEGGSIKQLHRWILNSSTYQQSSDGFDPRGSAIDPENRLLWSMPRKRLDFEAMRDSLLAISGGLDRSMGGRPEEIAENPEARRRAVYGFIDRQNLPHLFRAFDFASPDTTCARRFQTTVPQQALFMMNNPFVQIQACDLVDRLGSAAETSFESRLARLFEIVLQRVPDRDETEMARAFFGSVRDREKWEEFAQALLMSNEVFFID